MIRRWGEAWNDYLVEASRYESSRRLARQGREGSRLNGLKNYPKVLVEGSLQMLVIT